MLLQVIKDYSQTFYSAGFVPAAHVYFSGAADSTQPVLRQEVLGSISQAPARQAAAHVLGTGASAAGPSGDQAGAQAAAGRPARASGSMQANGQIKKPKWLKMSK